MKSREKQSTEAIDMPRQSVEIAGGAYRKGSRNEATARRTRRRGRSRRRGRRKMKEKKKKQKKKKKKKKRERRNTVLR